MKTKNRRPGDGSITKRPDGSYQARIMIDGVRKSFYGKSEKEALDKLRKYQVDSYYGIKTSDLKLSAYFESWLKNVKYGQLKPASYDRLERTYKLYIANRLGKIPISRITSQKCQLLINDTAQKYSYSTVKKIYEALNACLKYATDVDHISKNPMAAVHLPRESSFTKETKEIAIPTDEDMDRLIQVGTEQFSTGKYIINQNYVDAYRLIAETGLRVGELLALTWDKVSLSDSTARIDSSISEIVNRNSKKNSKTEISAPHYKRIVTDTKTKSGTRTIYLNNEAVSILERIKNRYTKSGIGPEYVICNTKGKVATYHDLQRTLTRLCDKAGLKRFGLHTLRHYFASRCIANGVEMLALSKHLGHSKPSVTLNVYAHLMPQQNSAFKNVLDNLR